MQLEDAAEKQLPNCRKGKEHFEDHVRAGHWAQGYALATRELMMESIVCAVRESGLVPEFGRGLKPPALEKGCGPEGPLFTSVAESIRGHRRCAFGCVSGGTRPY